MFEREYAMSFVLGLIDDCYDREYQPLMEQPMWFGEFCSSCGLFLMSVVSEGSGDHLLHFGVWSHCPGVDDNFYYLDNWHLRDIFAHFRVQALCSHYHLLVLFGWKKRRRSYESDFYGFRYSPCYMENVSISPSPNVNRWWRKGEYSLSPLILCD